MARRRQRRRFTGEEKMSLLRRHLLEQVPVSDLCDEHGLNPTVFYRWQKTLFEHGAVAFERIGDTAEHKLTQQVEVLSTRLRHKDEVIAEIMAEHIRLKKTLGVI